MPDEKTSCPHYDVAIVGGGPAGLPLAIVLSGLHPHYRAVPQFTAGYGPLARRLADFPGSLLGLDLLDLVEQGIAPLELFRLLHHYAQDFRSLDDAPLEFRPGPSANVALFSRESVGGLWNNVPKNLLTLSPGRWMEFTFYPLAQWAAETGRKLDPNALIIKRDVVDYYHSVPKRFGASERFHTNHNVTRISRDPKGFRVEGETVSAGESFACTAQFVVYAVGQRCTLRKLNVPGENLPYVTNQYDKPEDFPGHRILVVGGGRSADWAATELHDAGRDVVYVMQQDRANHWRLINDSREGLPYYARIAAILEEPSARMRVCYETKVTRFEADGTVHLRTDAGNEQSLRVDHAILEIGGEVDYGPLESLGDFTLVEKHDRYRFQCMQMATHPHNYESVDMPGLYPGGYLSQGINNVVVAMHGATYAIAADILQRLGRMERRPL